MYGQIHCCIRSLVLEKFGAEVWQKIIEESKLDEISDFMVFHHYNDEPTMRLVVATAKVADLDVAVVLEVFGEYFLEYCFKHGYDKMLNTLGGSFESFIQNLDSLHTLLQLSYKTINAPSFRAIKKSDGLLELHYYSFRTGMYPIVIGILREVGRRLFNCSVKCSVIQRINDMESVITGVDGQSFKEYVIFEVHILEKTSDENHNESGPSQTGKCKAVSICAGQQQGQITSRNATNTHLSPGVFCEVFPYHVLFGRDMSILQIGNGLARLCPHVLHSLAVGEKVKMNQVFTMIHPLMDICYNNILHFMNAVYLLQIKPINGHTSPSLVIKGQIVPEPKEESLFFIGSPRIESLADLKSHNIYLSDIPLYDVTRELVLLNQQRIAEIEVSKKLDETTAELKRTALALENEKAKTDRLLHEMLPKKVADQLKQGKTVEAEKFNEVTIFFSDIVTFTNIASASTPMAIVNMLNSLYEKFDKLTSIHDVYKVETIGDAYMVVSGAPEAIDDHAQRVADFALSAVCAAKEVKSPATGKSLQIRVGLHTGPVVAGVVGVRMPRYCLFGDTVNTASRMESHGVPECIHCSQTTYKSLKKSGEMYKFKPRGETFVKGKGMLSTYFLISNGKKSIAEPPPEVFEKKSDEKKSESDKKDKTVEQNSAKIGNSTIMSVTSLQQKSKTCELL